MHSTSTTNVQPEKIGLRASLQQAWPRVWPLLLLAFGIRLFFLLVGAKLYYNGRQIDIYTNGDSYSYVLSFRNLLDYGRYTFDLTEPDAAVGRLPGYPFFYGLHYLIFGPQRALFATAVSQVVLDTLGIWLVYAITVHLAGPRSWAPLLAGLLLTFYPFSIVWVPIMGTETLGLFLVLLWWATLLLARPRVRTWLLLGALLALIIYVREFLGVCLAVTFVYLLLTAHQRQGSWLKPAAWVTTGFLALYIWWPVRNYVTLGRFIPLKPAAAGYANLREDTQSALAWVLTWTNDVTMGIDEVLVAPKPTFPPDVIATPAEHQLIDSLVTLSRTCGSSFHVRAALNSIPPLPPGAPVTDERRYMMPQEVNTLRQHNCNEAISQGFNRLRASYISRHPIQARLAVPLQNIQKIFFKSQFIAVNKGPMTLGQRISTPLFAWRSLLLFLGLAGAWYSRRTSGVWPALLFSSIIFGYMAIVFRSMEMRYLLQADVLLLVPAALLLARWLPRRWQPATNALARR